MSPSDLRAQTDVALRDQLLAEPSVQRSIKRFERDTKQLETRRQLLATSVRLTKELTPEVWSVVHRCAEQLQVETEVELFVQPSPHLNAGCYRPEDGRVFVMFTSELLEAFDEPELAFVVGHELGHFIFGHHDLPVGWLLRGPEPVGARTALRVFAWSRWAEVSADRAGLWCARDLDAVARALFKLASGLRQGAAHVVMDALLGQVDALASFGGGAADDQPRADWFSTHPFSPLRLKTAKLFASSEMIQPGGTSQADLEAAVTDVMQLMEPGYLQDDSDASIAMRRLLLAGSVIIANVTGPMSDAERDAIEEFLGEGKVTSRLSVDALRGDLPARVAKVVELVVPSRRAQVMRDMCVVAKADGHVSEDERDFLGQLARDLGLGSDFICACLDGPEDLD
ncbi:MAG: M48 family metallopeptidase [Planctomycetota bacterium]